VKVWLAWLERHVYNEVGVIKTPIGNLPKYNDLKNLFNAILDKEYTAELYIKHFSLYVDNIIGRIDLQIEAYGKEVNVPARLFEVLKEQKEGMLALRDKYGSIIKPSELEEV